MKLSNPKDIIGSNKIPFHLVPNTFIAGLSLAFLEGALKYGRSNFRKVGVRASIYNDALERHMKAWFEGEDIDPESGISHLLKAGACLAILYDAQQADKLQDDRMFEGGYEKTTKELTPHIKKLKAIHRNKKPRHYYHGIK